MRPARMALLPAPLGPCTKLMFGPKLMRSELQGKGAAGESKTSVSEPRANQLKVQGQRRCRYARMVHKVDEAQALDDARFGGPVLPPSRVRRQGQRKTKTSGRQRAVKKSKRAAKVTLAALVFGQQKTSRRPASLRQSMARRPRAGERRCVRAAGCCSASSSARRRKATQTRQERKAGSFACAALFTAAPQGQRAARQAGGERGCPTAPRASLQHSQSRLSRRQTGWAGLGRWAPRRRAPPPRASPHRRRRRRPRHCGRPCSSVAGEREREREAATPPKR